MSTDLSHFKNAFFEESQEHLTTIEEGLLQLEQRPEDIDLLNRIFRGAHSIKGNSGMFGFTAVSQFTHKMESVLDQLRSSQMVVTVEITDLLLQSLDCLKTLIDCAKTGDSPDESQIATLGAQLEACQGGTVAAKPNAAEAAPRHSQLPGSHHFTITWVPPRYLFQRGLDPVQFIKELGDLGSVTSVILDPSRLPALADLDPEQCYLGWTIEMDTVKDLKVIEAVFDFVREDSTLTIVDTPPPADESQAAAEGTKPLGEILVETGVVSHSQLNQALSQQKRVGEILVEQKIATPEQISEALKKQTESSAPTKKAETPSIRVDTVKIDRLINLVGELVITQSMLSDLGSRFEMSQLPVVLERVAQLERNTREIQERVMGIRMVPIGNAFSRFPRLVRDLSGKAGKRIQLILSGEETELDKTVIEKIAVEGMRFQPGDALFRIVDTSSMWVMAEVYEQDLGLVKVGDAARVTVNAWPGQPIEGRVTFIYPTIGKESRTAKLRIEVANPDGRLRADMAATVEIATPLDGSRLAVPDSAVIDSGRRQVVLVERGEGRFEPRPVKLGARVPGWVQVLDGLAAGERVVTQATFLIDAESNIRAALAAFTAGDGK